MTITVIQQRVLFQSAFEWNTRDYTNEFVNGLEAIGHMNFHELCPEKERLHDIRNKPIIHIMEDQNCTWLFLARSNKMN